MIERTFIAIKPDAVQRGLIGEIIKRFENVGLKIVGMKMVWMDKEFSKKHYSAHVEKPFYAALEAFMTEGPVVAAVIEGVNCIDIVRKIVGATEPNAAPPGTIRGDFAHVTYGYADTKGIAIKNVIHASDKEGAQKEIELWFDEKEIHTYKIVNELHTR